MDKLENKAVQHVRDLLKKIDTQPTYNLVSTAIREKNDSDQQRSIMIQLADCNYKNITAIVKEACEWLDQLVE